jgi:hypothetical protein
VSTRSTPPPSAADLLDRLAKDLREAAGKMLAMASVAEDIAKMFRGQP